MFSCSVGVVLMNSLEIHSSPNNKKEVEKDNASNWIMDSLHNVMEGSRYPHARAAKFM